MRSEPRLLPLIASLGIALSACHDPPGDGSLLINMNVLATRAPFSLLAFTANRIELFYGSAPQPPDDADACVMGGGFALEASPVAVQVDLSTTGSRGIGAFFAPPGQITEIRMAVQGAGATVAGQSRRAHLERRCAGGDTNGLFRFVPLPGEILTITSGQTTIVEAPFDPLTDIEVDGLGGGFGQKGLDEHLPGSCGDRPCGKPFKLSSDYGLHVALEAAPVRELEPPPQFAPGFVHVSFRSGVSTARIAAIHQSFGTAVARTAHNGRWQTVQLPPGISEGIGLLEYKLLPEVELATLSYTITYESRTPTEWPQDGGTRQWHLKRTRSERAWDFTTGASIAPDGGIYIPIVAVADNTINIYNRDLQENIYLDQTEISSSRPRNPDCSSLTPQQVVDAGLIPGGILTLVDTPEPATGGADGLVTLVDMNRAPNFGRLAAVMRARGEPIPTPPERIGLQHLLFPEPWQADGGTVPRCGLLEDLRDQVVSGTDAGNGYVDDIAGWDFVFDRNTLVSNIVSPGQPPIGGEGTGHGHQVSGVIAGVSNEDSVMPTSSSSSLQFPRFWLDPDYVGQAWHVRILPARVNSSGATDRFPGGTPNYGDVGAIQEGLNYAISTGAEVINTSWGIGCIKPGVLPDAGRRLECPDFVDKRTELEATFKTIPLDRVLLVVGPANVPIDLDRDDKFIDLPAQLRLPTQINVASIVRDDSFAPFSSFGLKTFQIVAPGIGIHVLSFAGSGDLGGGLPPTTGVESMAQAGNSLAAPQVSGAAALVLSRYPQLRGNPSAVRQHIFSKASAVPGAVDKVAGGRLLDVGAAVEFPP